LLSINGSSVDLKKGRNLTVTRPARVTDTIYGFTL